MPLFGLGVSSRGFVQWGSSGFRLWILFSVSSLDFVSGVAQNGEGPGRHITGMPSIAATVSRSDLLEHCRAESRLFGLRDKLFFSFDVWWEDYSLDLPGATGLRERHPAVPTIRIQERRSTSRLTSRLSVDTPALRKGAEARSTRKGLISQITPSSERSVL